MKPSPERRAKLRNMRRVAQRVAQTRANRRNFALWAMRDARANDWSEEFLADVIVASMTPSRSRFGIYGPCFYCGDWPGSLDTFNSVSPGLGAWLCLLLAAAGAAVALVRFVSPRAFTPATAAPVARPPAGPFPPGYPTQYASQYPVSYPAPYGAPYPTP